MFPTAGIDRTKVGLEKVVPATAVEPVGDPSEVIHGVTHASVFPVDQPKVTIVEEVQVVRVVMAQHQIRLSDTRSIALCLSDHIKKRAKASRNAGSSRRNDPHPSSYVAMGVESAVDRTKRVYVSQQRRDPSHHCRCAELISGHVARL